MKWSEQVLLLNQLTGEKNYFFQVDGLKLHVHVVPDAKPPFLWWVTPSTHSRSGKADDFDHWLQCFQNVGMANEAVG